jgi:lambda family phage portal protein
MKFKWPFANKGARKGRALSVRGFAAAAVDRLIANWTWDGGFSAQEVASGLSTIRARSRQMAKDDPHMRRYLQLVATNIVGDGFSFKSTPHDGEPGKFRLDEKAAKFIEYHFWRWCSSPEWCDATGRKTVAEIDRLNCKTWARDGEYFMILESAQNPYGISLRVIRPDYVAEWYSVDRLDNGNVVRCGVELSLPFLKPVAYYIQTTQPYAYVTTTRGPLARIAASRVIHGFMQEDEDQPRGIPWAHASLVKLKMLHEFDRAEITAARDEACSVRSYYAPKGDEELLADLTSPDNRDTASALTADKEPGQSEVLPIGWRSEVATPQHPNREITPFKDSMLKDVATGFGVEYANFANNWSGVSFSSVRAGTISERDMWMVLQDLKISQSKRPVFAAWLKSFLSLAISGNMPQSKFDKFFEHEFRGRRWLWVDPMKDVRAAEVAVANGWKTNTQVTADFGGDFADNVETKRQEQAIIAGDKKDSVPALNGAQISAAVEIVQSYAIGAIGKEAAIALLTAAGVPADAAQNMIDKQTVEKPKNEAPKEQVATV